MCVSVFWSLGPLQLTARNNTRENKDGGNECTVHGHALAGLSTVLTPSASASKQCLYFCWYDFYCWKGQNIFDQETGLLMKFECFKA